MLLETTEQRGISLDRILENWQGHRRLTRKVIEAFPEKELFEFSIGGMRPFADMAMELYCLADAGILSALTGEWVSIDDLEYHDKDQTKQTKERLLQRWDMLTKRLDEIWPQIPGYRFFEIEKAFGAYEGEVISNMQYWIDNEIHHRAQGYVYLRALGIEPPFFWDRY